MFTGLIEEIGILEKVINKGSGACVSIQAKKVLEGVKLGDSIAVDGVCLTVTNFDGGRFEADVMPATVEQTRLKTLKRGDAVHLERALRVGDRLGGHFVSGHVDGQSRVISLKKEDEAYRLRLERSQSFWAQVVQKGSIAINGVSLTIDGLSDEWLEVSLVNHTQGETALTELKAGEQVNIESDMLLKYVHSLMTHSSGLGNSNESSSNITMSQLKNAGFL